MGYWVKFIVFTMIAALIAVISLFYYYGHELPDYRQLETYNPPLVSRIYAQNGKIIQEYADEKRIYIDYEQIPPIVVKAFLSAEDKNFFEHQGLDYFGIIRAAIKNILNLGQNKGLSGGSTITQQVVKNFLLTSERSLERKIKEAILAYRISKVYSKERILELYLNQIFLGHNSYGLVSASLNYFNKDVPDLTIAEAAMLAAMPKAPSYVNPLKNQERAKARRDWVINRMLEDQFINGKEAEEAIASPIITVQRRDTEFAIGADFYAEAVRLKLVERFGEKEVYTQGYSVLTYMDEKLQKAATESLRKGILKYDRLHGYRGPIAKLDGKGKDLLEDFSKWRFNAYEGGYITAVVTSANSQKADIAFKNGSTGVITLEQLKWARKPKPGQLRGPEIKSATEVLSVGDVILVKMISDQKYSLEQVPEVEGAIVVMEVETGKVLALTGGYSFEKSKFNRVTQAGRQPGSAFKPIVYLAALENGYEPNTIINDSSISVSQGPGLPMWRPKNYGNNYLGDITFRKALEKSRNVPTVKIALNIGLNKITEMASRLDVFQSPPTNLSVVLGAYETTLLKLTSAYNTIASGGRKITPRFIDHVSDRHSNILLAPAVSELKNDADGVPSLAYVQSQIIDPGVSYQLTSILEGVIQRGTGVRARQLNRVVAGKTGTTNDSFDTWFIGYTPDIVVGVYMGFDQPKTLGQKETGASLPLPIFIDFMKEVEGVLPNRKFPMPNSIDMVSVYDDTGVPVASSEKRDAAIINEAFLVKEGSQASREYKAENRDLWTSNSELNGVY